jgi:small subunit ribosomal protein S1
VMKFLALCIVLSALCIVSGFRPASVRRDASSTLSMSITAERTTPKSDTLSSVKGRSTGRDDIEGLMMEDGDSTTYEMFAEADVESANPPKVGETITGTVIEMDDNGALLSIAGKMSGYLPLKEASLIPIKHVNTVVNIGEEITAEVIGTLRGMPVISLRSAQLVTAWEEILKIRAADETFQAKVVEVNRGGAVVEAKGLKAFLPGSHYLGVPDESIIGSTLNVKFLDVNEEEGKLVVSQRRALMENQTELTRGEVVSGTITGLRQYGAFLELDGGIAGLLHISQISYDRIDSLETLFSIGQRCKVMILEHDKANGRVALSTKTLEPSPGDMLKDMQGVFDKADETAKKYHARMEAEREAREAAAKDIVAGLGGNSATDSNGDPLVSVADSIESILASIVSDSPEDAPADAAAE